jgi:arsenate reductase
MFFNILQNNIFSEAHMTDPILPPKRSPTNMISTQMQERPSILVICTGNAARSQMAEALLKHICGEEYDVFSAGTRPWVVRPGAIEAMAELGLDISKNRSKSVDEFADRSIDYVLTLCDNAASECPTFPAAVRVIHHAIEDPVYAEGDLVARRIAFCRARDEIKEYLVNEFLPLIKKGNAG